MTVLIRPKTHVISTLWDSFHNNNSERIAWSTQASDHLDVRLIIRPRARKLQGQGKKSCPNIKLFHGLGSQSMVMIALSRVRCSSSGRFREYSISDDASRRCLGPLRSPLFVDLDLDQFNCTLHLDLSLLLSPVSRSVGLSPEIKIGRD